MRRTPSTVLVPGVRPEVAGVDPSDDGASVAGGVAVAKLCSGVPATLSSSESPDEHAAIGIITIVAMAALTMRCRLGSRLRWRGSVRRSRGCSLVEAASGTSSPAGRIVNGAGPRFVGRRFDGWLTRSGWRRGSRRSARLLRRRVRESRRRRSRAACRRRRGSTVGGAGWGLCPVVAATDRFNRRKSPSAQSS